jgi:hypothetical protein
MRAARWLSIIFHPFVMVGVLAGTAAAARQTGAEAMTSVAIVLAFTVVPLLVLMIRQVRKGAWENVDASNTAERPVLYLVAGIGLAALIAYLVLGSPEAFMLRGVVATLIMLAVCAVATRWIKVSVHMAFAAFVATLLTLSGSIVGYAIVMVVPPLAWARLKLRRHTPAEVAVGSFIGGVSGVAVHLL